MSQTPSVGRIVLYQPTAAEQGNSTYDGGFPAVITRVWSDICVNLMVLRDADFPIYVTSVTAAAEPPYAPAERSWRWPGRDEPKTGAKS